MPDLTADQLIEILGLQPHAEGGRFIETFRAPEILSAAALPERYGEERTLSTAIYYLLTPDTFSEIHRLRTDEVYHFYLGDPVEMLLLRPDGSGEMFRLGTDLAGGERPQLVVGRGTWHGSRVVEVDLTWRLDSLVFHLVDGTFTTDMRVDLQAVRDGEPVATASERVVVEVPEAEMAGRRQEVVRRTLTLTLPEGDYELEFVLLDRLLGFRTLSRGELPVR